MKEIIVLSERGWRGARTCALKIVESGFACHVFIKGRPAKEVREFIPHHENITNVFIPRVVYFFCFPLLLALRLWFSKAVGVVVERKRAFKIVRGFPFFMKHVFWIKELDGEPYFEIKDSAEQKLEVSSFLKSL